jgi:hypothetical protein
LNYLFYDYNIKLNSYKFDKEYLYGHNNFEYFNSNKSYFDFDEDYLSDYQNFDYYDSNNSYSELDDGYSYYNSNFQYLNSYNNYLELHNDCIYDNPNFQYLNSNESYFEFDNIGVYSNFEILNYVNKYVWLKTFLKKKLIGGGNKIILNNYLILEKILNYNKKLNEKPAIIDVKSIKNIYNYCIKNNYKYKNSKYFKNIYNYNKNELSKEHNFDSLYLNKEKNVVDGLLFYNCNIYNENFNISNKFDVGLECVLSPKKIFKIGFPFKKFYNLIIKVVENDKKNQKKIKIYGDSNYNNLGLVEKNINLEIYKLKSNYKKKQLSFTKKLFKNFLNLTLEYIKNTKTFKLDFLYNFQNPYYFNFNKYIREPYIKESAIANKNILKKKTNFGEIKTNTLKKVKKEHTINIWDKKKINKIYYKNILNYVKKNKNYSNSIKLSYSDENELLFTDSLNLNTDFIVENSNFSKLIESNKFGYENNIKELDLLEYFGYKDFQNPIVFKINRDSDNYEEYDEDD